MATVDDVETFDTGRQNLRRGWIRSEGHAQNRVNRQQNDESHGIPPRNCRKNLLIVTAMSFDMPALIDHNGAKLGSSLFRVGDKYLRVR
jgi:hypothetical protein